MVKSIKYKVFFRILLIVILINVYIPICFSQKYLKEGDEELFNENYQNALDFYIKAHNQNPKRAEILYKIAQAKFYLKDYKGCIESATKAIIIDSTIADFYSYRATCKSMLNDFNGAIDDLNKSISFTGSNNLGLYFEKAKYKLRLDDLEGAMNDLNFITDSNPDFYDAFSLKANVKYYKAETKNDFESALIDINNAIHIQPSEKNLGLRSKIYFELGELQKAIEDISEVIKINKLEDEYVMARAYMYDLLGNHELALIDYSKTIEMDSTAPEAYYNRGLLYHTKFKDYSAAIKDFTKASELDSLDPAPFRRLAIARYRTDEYELALTAAQKAIELDPNHPDPYYYRALIRKDSKQFTDAINDLTKVTILKNNYSSAYFQLGFILNEQGKHEEALSNYLKVVEFNSKYPYGLLNTAETYLLMGNYKISKEFAMKVLTSVDDNREHAIGQFLICVNQRLLGEKTSESELQLKLFMEKAMPVTWSFDMMIEALTKMKTSPSDIQYIRGLISKFRIEK